MSDIYAGKTYMVDWLPQRKKLRLKGYDYSSPGFYFITICTQGKIQWLGHIANDEICLSAVGKIVQSEWESLPQKFPGLELDGFVVMPNHMHGILRLTEHLQYNKPGQTLKPTLSKIVADYKTSMTYRIHHFTAIPDFSWQKSFFDVIMRNERMLHRTRNYIAKNPGRWIGDRFYIQDTKKVIDTSQPSTE